jgi:hypothetical protein
VTTRISRAGARLDLGEPDPHDSATVLRVDGRLFLDTTDGRRLLATGATLGLAFGRGRSERVEDRPTREVIEQDIESLLGRDPGRRPPHLAWEQLSEVLSHEAITLNEDELTAVPFVVEFSDELLAELDRGDGLLS